MARQLAVNPTCRACTLDIQSGDLVVFDHGGLIHVKCLISAGGDAEILARFLAANPDRRYCHTCLAASLGVSGEAVRKAVTRLRVSSGYRVVPTQCSVCGNNRVTIQRPL